MDNTSFSVVTPNRNRLASLQKVLPSWQRCEQVSEIVIVDFGGVPALTPQHFDSPHKIRVLRVLNPDCWRIGLAINLGVDHCRNDTICKLDSDIAIRDGAQLGALSTAQAFYRGRAGTTVSNGQVLFDKAHWQRVGGYNEWLSGYGYDDSDYYSRLRRSGIAERAIPPTSLNEHTHSNEVRAATDLRSEFFNINLSDPDARLLYMLSRNTYLGMLRPWSADLRLHYRSEPLEEGMVAIELEKLSDDYRWADGMANMLAVVRASGTQQNVSLLNGLVARYLAETGGL
jgi:glycosyltransferase involved in cell wall biosynthesis